MVATVRRRGGPRHAGARRASFARPQAPSAPATSPRPSWAVGPNRPNQTQSDRCTRRSKCQFKQHIVLPRAETAAYCSVDCQRPMTSPCANRTDGIRPVAKPQVNQASAVPHESKSHTADNGVIAISSNFAADAENGHEIDKSPLYGFWHNGNGRQCRSKGTKADLAGVRGGRQRRCECTEADFADIAGGRQRRSKSTKTHIAGINDGCGAGRAEVKHLWNPFRMFVSVFRLSLTK